MEPKYQVAMFAPTGERILVTFKEAHQDWSDTGYQPIESVEVVPTIVAAEDEVAPTEEVVAE